MGDVIRLLPYGAQEFTTVSLTCLCPVCEGPVRWIRSTDAVGSSTRRRGLEMACAGSCSWMGVLTVALDDKGPGRG